VTKQGADQRYRLNSAELALELDDYVRRHGIRAFLECRCVGAVTRGKTIKAIITEDRSGRRAISARMFLDASGDDELLRHAGSPCWKNSALQPMSLQALASGLGDKKWEIWDQVKRYASEYSYPLENGVPWSTPFPSAGEITNVFGARMHDFDGSDADQMTVALMEGRRRQRALLAMIRKHISTEASCVALAPGMGVRETWHAHCMHCLRGAELLKGKAFRDTIAYGTYPVDIHSESGTQLRYLDGREVFIDRSGTKTERWWKKEGNSQPFYQIPLASMIPIGSKNLLVAGRLIDADQEGFGAVRVMVNTNQTGEAAGVAAAIALQSGKGVHDLSPELVRSTLVAGGSLFPSSFEGRVQCRQGATR